MAKETGLGDNLYVDGYDLSGDIGAITSLNSSRALLDVTGIDVDAHERLPGLRDGELSFNNWYNPSDGSDPDDPTGAHEVLKDIENERHTMYYRGTSLGGPVAAFIGAQASYQLNRNNDGSLSGTVQVMNAGGRGIEWGRSLTAGKQNATGAGNLTGVLDPDFPNGNTVDLSAYLQIFAIEGSAGDDVAFKLQHSDYFSAVAADDDAIRTVTNLTNTTLAANGIGFTGTVEPRRVTITIVDTVPSIVAGSVLITGTDSKGDAQTESVSIAGGAGVYTSTKFFATVASVTISGATVLGGSGDETIKVGVEAAVVSYTDIAGAAFTAVDIAEAPTREHIVADGPIKRAIRAVISTVDGFDSCDFAIAYKRT